jgi:hypothetical protein
MNYSLKKLLSLRWQGGVEEIVAKNNTIEYAYKSEPVFTKNP